MKKAGIRRLFFRPVQNEWRGAVQVLAAPELVEQVFGAQLTEVF